MGTMLGVVLGYVLRGTTGSAGFNRVVDQAKAVGESPEFQGLVQAVKTHARHTLRDVTATLAQRAEQLSDVFEAEAESPPPTDPWARWGLSPVADPTADQVENPPD